MFAMLAGLTALPWLMLDDAARHRTALRFRRTDLAWVKSLFQKHDPRRQTPDVIHRFGSTKRTQSAAQLPQSSCARSAASPPKLTPASPPLRTMMVPANPFGRYLNISAEVSEVPGGIRSQGLQLGSLRCRVGR